MDAAACTQSHSLTEDHYQNMYSDAEPIASPFVDWDARRKAVP